MQNIESLLKVNGKGTRYYSDRVIVQPFLSSDSPEVKTML